jgi:hypothetical protein
MIHYKKFIYKNDLYVIRLIKDSYTFEYYNIDIVEKRWYGWKRLDRKYTRVIDDNPVRLVAAIKETIKLYLAKTSTEVEDCDKEIEDLYQT